MENNNLACIYDDTKASIDKLLIDIFANFVDNELRKIYNL